MKTRPTWLGALLLAAAFACAAQQPPEPGEGGMAVQAGADHGPVDDEAIDEAQVRAAREASRHYHARIAAELAATGKPRELAFAANLLAFVRFAETAGAGMVPDGSAPSRARAGDPRAAQWRRLASARAGADVVANLLLMQGNDAADAGIRREAAERWRRVEPDNLAPELLGDAVPADWLPQAGSYRRFDWHYYEVLRWMQATLAAHPPLAAEDAMRGDERMPADLEAAIAALGLQAAVALPNLSPLVVACSEGALDSAPTRRGDCRQVGQVMADGSDTRLGTSVGIALLLRTAASPAGRDDAIARQRRNDWQMWQWGRLAAEQADGGAAQFVRMLLDPSIHSEQDLAERMLGDAGVPLDPPAGWRSPWRHGEGGG